MGVAEVYAKHMGCVTRLPRRFLLVGPAPSGTHAGSYSQPALHVSSATVNGLCLLPHLPPTISCRWRFPLDDHSSARCRVSPQCVSSWYHSGTRLQSRSTKPHYTEPVTLSPNGMHDAIHERPLDSAPARAAASNPFTRSSSDYLSLPPRSMMAIYFLKMRGFLSSSISADRVLCIVHRARQELNSSVILVLLPLDTLAI